MALAITLKDTLRGRELPFEPLAPGRVGMYVCGPTVYDFIHVGNARPFIAFDVVRRFFTFAGYDVTYIQNITDVDDKIIARAKEAGEPASAFADRFARAYLEDIAALGILPASANPRATEVIPEIIALIAKLLDSGHAYARESGDVFYRVSSFPSYGKLSGKRLDDLIAGASARTDATVDALKENPVDFALWKSPKADDEPRWEAPWGAGRPGWHIECSAMSISRLGESFDIHAGGADLIHPHHENEIAQSEAATGKPFATYWLHNGYLTIEFDRERLPAALRTKLADLQRLAQAGAEPDRQRVLADELAGENLHVTLADDGLPVIDDRGELAIKGGKTYGGLPTVREILARGYEGMVVRLFMLRGHYRGPLSFSWARLDEARAQLARYREFRRRLDDALKAAQARERGKAAPMGDPLLGETEEFREAFVARMSADFNTSGALGVIFQQIGALNKRLDAGLPSAAAIKQARDLFDTYDEVLGLATRTAAATLDAEEQALLDRRAEARAARDWAASDRLRDELAAHGIAVKDTKDGQTWTRS